MPGEEFPIIFYFYIFKNKIFCLINYKNNQFLKIISENIRSKNDVEDAVAFKVEYEDKLTSRPRSHTERHLTIFFKEKY